MKNSIIAFLAGMLAAGLLYLKNKNPDIVNVSGDLIEEQKIKDNRKFKGGGFVPDQNGGVMIYGSMKRHEVIQIWKDLKR
jgi:hypothetical protein